MKDNEIKYFVGDGNLYKKDIIPLEHQEMGWWCYDRGTGKWYYYDSSEEFWFIIKEIREIREVSKTEAFALMV